MEPRTTNILHTCLTTEFKFRNRLPVNILESSRFLEVLKARSQSIQPFLKPIAPEGVRVSNFHQSFQEVPTLSLSFWFAQLPKCPHFLSPQC